MKKYLICIFIALLIAFLKTMPEEEEIKEVTQIKEEVVKTVKLLNQDKIIEIPLEDYIIGVVACEMPALFEMEALKAQAVASRTFALEKMNNKNTYDLENSTNDQCYESIESMQDKWKTNYNNYYTKIKEAVYDTKGQHLTYDGKIIKAYYFSMTNGYTEDVQSVFGEKLDYLVSTDSLWDKKVASYQKDISFDEIGFLEKLGIKEDNITNIEINERNESNRIAYITVNKKKFKGTTFRNLLGLRSTDFDIDYNDGIVSITTRGYGHGVGMSQYGANAMAKEGYKYLDILVYFYKNTEIKNV